MTQAQAVRLACQVVVLYLLFWVISDLTALPREMLSVYEAWSFPALSARGSFYLREQILLLAANVLRMTMWLGLALWFYQGGPRVQRWFGAEKPLESAKASSTID